MTDSDESIMVRARGLTRQFGPLTAVDDLTLEVFRGEIFGLVGPDGAGKTTTLRLLCGLLDPSEGEAWVTGHSVKEGTEVIKDRIGYMAQRFGLYNDLTVEENMVFYSDLFGISPSDRDDLMPHLLKMTRMGPFRDRWAGRLSGGMKQKLALMCTLLHHPRILFLDEPTNGVDPVSRRDFWKILYQLVRDGLTVFLTTAYLDEAERCNRVGLMHHGRLIHCDAPEALRQQVDELCYEVRTPNQRKVREVLRECKGVMSAQVTGEAVHVFVSRALGSVRPLELALSAKGLGPAEFRQIVPSLEDVFVALISKAE